MVPSASLIVIGGVLGSSGVTEIMFVKVGPHEVKPREPGVKSTEELS